MSAAELAVRPVLGLPEVEPGARLGELIAARAEPVDGDVVVVSQKVVSKAEGRLRRLGDVEPGAEARRLAAELGKDAAMVELVLAESRAVLRAERGVLIVETHHGLVCANAGIDSSNVEEGVVCLLPEDPDASARRLRAEITAFAAGTTSLDRPITAIGGSRRGRVGVAGHSPSADPDPPSPSTPPAPAVIVADSFGRAWRLGQAEVAIGCAGLVALDDWRGRRDAGGRELEATAIAIADQAAGAADLVRGKDGGVPAAVLRGLGRFVTAADGPGAAALRRPPAEDLFR